MSRPAPESQTDSGDRGLNAFCSSYKARHQNIFKPWGLVDNMRKMCAGPTFYDTPPGTIPKIRLPDWLLCVWTRVSLWNFCLESVSQHFIPADLFQLIEVWGLRARILCSIPTTMTHLSSENPTSTAGASLVYILSRLKWYVSTFYSNVFCSTASTDKATDPLRSKSVHLRMASFPFKPLTTLPNCFLSIHRTDQMSFTIVSDSTTNPLRLPNSSSHSRPRLTQRQARQLESCLSFCWAFVIITITV